MPDPGLGLYVPLGMIVLVEGGLLALTALHLWTPYGLWQTGLIALPLYSIGLGGTLAVLPALLWETARTDDASSVSSSSD